MKKSWKRIIACVICAFMVLSELSLVEPKGFQAMEVYASYAEKKAGDINGDGDVNSKDLTRLMKFTSGEDVSVVEQAVDTNGDGDFDSKDLTHLMRNLSGDDSAELHISAVDPNTCSHHIEKVAAVASTCTEGGHKTYYQCDECGSKFSDSEGLHAITDEEVMTDPLGHDPVEDPEVLPSATTSGLTKGFHCRRCGAVLQAQEVIPPTENYIIFDCYNGDDYLQAIGVSNPNECTYDPATGKTLKHLTVSGYRFLGWFDGQGDNAEQVKSIKAGETGEIYLYAHWEILNYRVSFESDLIPVDEITYSVDRGVVLPTPKLDGYLFVGWSDNDGNVIKKIAKGTTGHKTYTANWMSERNQAWTKKNIGKPIIYEDTENNMILFSYEIGQIKNVPVSVIHDFGKINSSGVSREITKEVTYSFSTEMMQNYTKSIAEATTESFGWTLNSGWEKGMTISQEWLEQNQMTEEEAKEICTNETNNWYVSSGKSGTDTTTTYNTTDTQDLKSTTRNYKSSLSNTHEQKTDVSAEITASQKVYGSVKIGNAASPVSGEVGAEVSLEESLHSGRSRSDEYTFGSEGSNGGGTNSGTITHTGSTTEHQGSWNSEEGHGGSSSLTSTDAIRKGFSRTLAEKSNKGQSYIVNEDSSQTQGFVAQSNVSDNYTTGVTYSTVQGSKETLTFRTENTVTGYHRWIMVSDATVFGVVGYDIKTNSFFTTSYTIMDDQMRPFEDYSYSSGTYDDNQTGVITFNVPTDIRDYVMDRVNASEGLQVSRAGKVTGYSGTDDLVIIPEYKVLTGVDGKPSVVKVTGLTSDAFAGNQTIIGVKLSDFISEIPDNAFEGCSNLQYITSKSLTKIGKEAFKNCPGLKYAYISKSITELGDNAFDDVETMVVNASKTAIIKTVSSFSADEMVIGIDESCNDLKNTEIHVNSDTRTFMLNAYGKTFNDVVINSDAAKTTITNATFNSSGAIPLKISSPEIVLQEITVNAPGLAAAFSADNASIALYGESNLNSDGENALLCKQISLSTVKDDLASCLHVFGNILGKSPKPSYKYNNKLILTVTNGDYVFITDEQFDKYIQGSFQITFDPCGGTMDDTTITGYYGTEIGELPTPEREHYTFDGWYQHKADNTQVKVESTTKFNDTSNIKLYAHWTPVSYQLTFNPGDGNVTETERSVAYGAAYGELPVPTRDYYDFVGWFTSATPDVGTDTPVTGDMLMGGSDVTLYAAWTEKATSDWVKESDMPSDAQIISEKWVYTLTQNKESSNSSESGWTGTGNYWKQTSSGSANYAYFPDGYDQNNWYYQNFMKGPYGAYDNGSTKRDVNNQWAGYIYWHWMYNTAADGTATRAIYDRYGTGPDNGYLYQYFFAFTHWKGDYQSDLYYCNSRSIRNYIVNDTHTSNAECGGATRWFRFDYYTSSYTDYQKIYKYQKITNGLESSTAVNNGTDPSTGGQISNVTKYVKYRAK